MIQKKSGAVTVSHLRFGPHKIHSAYEIQEGQADFVACHQPRFLNLYPMLEKARQGAVFLLNSSAAPDELWNTLPENRSTTADRKADPSVLPLMPTG